MEGNWIMSMGEISDRVRDAGNGCHTVEPGDKEITENSRGWSMVRS